MYKEKLNSVKMLSNNKLIFTKATGHTIYPTDINNSLKEPNKTVDFRYATKPIIILAILCGLGRNEKAIQNIWFHYYARFIPIIILILVPALFIYGIVLNMLEYYPSFDSMSNIMISTIVTDALWACFLFLLIFCATVRQHFLNTASNKQLFSYIDFIDRSLFIPTECFVKFRNNILKILIIWLIDKLFSFVEGLMLYHKYKNNLVMFSFMSIFMMDVCTLQYITDIKIVSNRIRLINKLLIHYDKVDDIYPFEIDLSLNNHSNHEVITNKNICQQDDKIKSNILRIVHLYDKLADIIDLLNSTHGIQILLIIICCFTCLLSTLNASILMYIVGTFDRITVSNLVIWILHFIIQLVLIIIEAEKLNSEMRQINSTVNTLMVNQNISDSQRSLLSVASQHIAARSTSLTACNFFTINSSLFTAFLSTLSTYAILLLQMMSFK